MPTTAELTKIITDAIAKSYAENVRFDANAEINQREIIQQNMTVINPPGQCEACLRIFIGDESSDQKDIFLDPSRDYVQQGICKTSCTTSLIGAVQEANVIFSTDAKIEPLTPEQVREIAEDAQSRIINDLPKELVPSREDLARIINNITVDGTASQTIQQTLIASQEIYLEGPGSVKNVKMSMIVNAIMRAIAETSMKQVSETIYTLVPSISDWSEEILDDMWTMYKPQWIFLILSLGASLVLLLTTKVLKVTKSLTKTVLIVFSTVFVAFSVFLFIFFT